MSKVSVIIPLYNSAQHLPSLFENIARQSIAADLEFVFIDDHGCDDGAALARSLAAGCSLRCIFGATVANSGPGGARNVGLGIAGGEYIAFLDADDALDPLFCEKLYGAAKAVGADLACCDILKIDGGRDEVWANPSVKSGPLCESGRENFLRRYKSCFTSFIYRREFIAESGIAFPPTRSAEDSCFLAEALLCAAGIAQVKEPLYRYIYRAGSLSTAADGGRYRQRLASFDSLLEFARRKGLYSGRKAELLDYIYIKKALITGVRDCPAARGEIWRRCTSQVPAWRRSRFLRRDPKAIAALAAIRLHLI